jgi:HK97 family phage prohead protease
MTTEHKKFYPTKILSIDEENHRVWARFTDDQPDREGEIMDADTWNFEDWMKAPTVLFGHKDWELPIGRGLEIRSGEENGVKYHEALIEFDVEDEESQRVWGKVARGFLKTLSVGYVTLRREGNRLLDNLLTEVSFVPVPANINAMVKRLNDGSLSEEDAKWMRDHAKATVKSLTEYIDNSDNRSNSNATKGKGAKSMDEDDLKKVGEQITTAVTEAVKPLTEKVESLSAEVEKLSKAKADDKDGDDSNKDKSDKKDSDANSDKKDEGNKEDADISDEEAEEILTQVDAMLSGDGEEDNNNEEENNSDED